MAICNHKSESVAQPLWILVKIHCKLRNFNKIRYLIFGDNPVFALGAQIPQPLIFYFLFEERELLTSLSLPCQGLLPCGALSLPFS